MPFIPLNNDLNSHLSLMFLMDYAFRPMETEFGYREITVSAGSKPRNFSIKGLTGESGEWYTPSVTILAK